jgi:hypothetical protein
MNNPLGDYTEWLVAKALNLELAILGALVFKSRVEG